METLMSPESLELLKKQRKAAKKKRKALKKAEAKLRKLEVGANPFGSPSSAPSSREQEPRVWTAEEKAQFNSRIKNEKSNLWRIGGKDPQKILEYIAANLSDESKNAAVRIARRDAAAWAEREIKEKAPF